VTEETAAHESAAIAEMLADFRLLARFLLHHGRPGEPRPAGGADVAAGGASSNVGRLVEFADLLVATPEAVASDNDQLRRLTSALVMANTLAAPATAVSLRLTFAFAGVDAGLYADTKDDHRIAASLRRLARYIAAFGVSLFLVTTILIAHVATGKQIIQQLGTVDVERAAVIAEITSFRSGFGRGGAAAESFSCADSADVANTTVNGDAEQQLCARWRDVAMRRTIVMQELALWNGRTERLGYISPIRWFGRTMPPPGVPETAWDAAPLRTSALLTVLTGAVLPAILGTLGSCAYVYRRLTEQIRSFTLERPEGLELFFRIILGSILGGLLGVVWTNGQPIHLEGVDLSLAALAFFVGFAVETVFSILDRAIASVGSLGRTPRG
jgi:hypothetical protein